jgi:hypothetical protein
MTDLLKPRPFVTHREEPGCDCSMCLGRVAVAEERARRREYAEAEIEQAGLTGDHAALALSAAMSADDDLDPDSFEEMVGHIIQDAARTQDDDRPVLIEDLWDEAYTYGREDR